MITAPNNAVLFRVAPRSSVAEPISEIRDAALKLLEVTPPYQKELARMLIANSFHTGGKFICNYEAIYSIVRILFSLNKRARSEDWAIVNQAVQYDPRLVFTALDLVCTEWFYEDGYFLFSVDSVSAELAADLASLAAASVKLVRRAG